MNNVKVAVSKLARRAVCSETISRLLCQINTRARIVMLHGLGTPDYPVNVFRAQLRFLSNVFQIVPLEDVLHSGSTPKNSRPSLALTFDDGLKNNFTAAYPLLSEFSAPATFFVCPGLVESGRWLWNHECRARLSRMSPDQLLAFAEQLGLRVCDIEGIVSKLKYMPNAERITAEERLRGLTPEFSPTESERQQYDLMSWDDLRALDPGLIAIGGHSCHHEILTQIEPCHLEREVGECKAWLERELKRPARHFCYPDGAYDAEVLECVSRHFETAVTTEYHLVPRNPSPLRLPRIPTAVNVHDLAWRVHRPTG